MAKRKPQSKRRQIIMRYGFIIALIGVMAGLIIYSAAQTTIVHRDDWNQKADSLLTRVYYVQPHRGDILADDGSVLATNVTAYDISLDYRASARHDSIFLVTLDSLCDSLAHYYPVRTAEEWRMRLAAPLAKKPSQRTQCQMLLKKRAYADYERILTFPFFNRYRKRYDHGLCINPVQVRLAPYGDMARRSVGRCRKKLVPKFEGSSCREDSIEMLEGYSGLEVALDKQLYGERGVAKMVPLTHGMRNWVDEPAQDGYTLRTTININMQDIVENELQAMLQQTQADWGTCLLMEVATGDIKAISNLDRDPKTGRYIEAMNYCMEAYEPGSVMKPISMIVALEDGYAFPLNRTMSIGSTYAYAGGAPIHDTHSPATLPVSQFIEYSSNIGMTKLLAPHYEGNLNGFRARLAELGFFDKFNTGLAYERTPFFPTLDPKAGGRVSLSRMTYGYSTMIPPLYTCAVYNAIANKGKFVRPRIVMERISAGGVEECPVSYVRDSICSQRNAKILMDMLYSVVYGQGGTAKSLRNSLVTVVGKTGTCRIAYEAKRDEKGNLVGQHGGYKENSYRLSFCGIFPYEDPQYTCIVLISNPAPEFKGAATTSGYVVKNVAEKMYAHGMLGTHSDYRAVQNTGTRPTLYACDEETTAAFRNAIGNPKVKKAISPKPTPMGTVPNVIGLGMRQALAVVEDNGFTFDFKGSGIAVRQVPPPGQKAKPGQKITVEFTLN